MTAMDTLTKEEFDMLFDTKLNVKQVPKVGANTSQTKPELKEELDSILKYLAECLEKENLTPLRFFKQADKNFNMVLTVEELKD